MHPEKKTQSPEGFYQDSLLVLRLNRLRHLPPATNAASVLTDAGLPLRVLEFGMAPEDTEKPFPTRELFFSYLSGLPGFLRVPLQIHRMIKTLESEFQTEGLPKLIIAEGLQEQIIARSLKAKYGIPYAVQVHEIYDPADLYGINRILLREERTALAGADFLIFPEKTRAKIYQERYQLTNRIFVCYNTPRKIAEPTPRDLRKELNLPADAFLLGFLGGIGPEGAFDVAIEALKEIPRAHFLIWGWADPNYQASLEALAVKSGIQGQVHFLGGLSKGKWETLAGVDASYCVYRPTLKRLEYSATASNKLWESLACGIPVLTSDSNDYRDLVTPPQVGIARPITVEGIQNGLRTLMEPETRREMSRNARKLHLESGHFEKQFASVLDYVKKYF